MVLDGGRLSSPLKNVFSSMSFWLFSLGACIWQLAKLKASTGILLCVCLILSSSSPSKVCACLLSLPEQPCICIPCLLFEKKLHWQSVSKTQWFLQTGVIVGTSCILVACSMLSLMLRTSVGLISEFGREMIGMALLCLLLVLSLWTSFLGTGAGTSPRAEQLA